MRVSWIPAGLIALSLGTGLAAGGEPRALKLVTSDGYIPGVPIVVRVEVHEADGRYARGLWDAEADLSTDRPDVTVSPTKVVLRNGMGAALVTIAGTRDFQLTASLGAIAASRSLGDRSAELAASPAVSGDIPGTATEWSGVVRVTAGVNVPAGRTLRILAGAIVLISGIQSGENGPGISVQGTFESLGTEEAPVTITARDPALAWGQIRHDGAAPSLYRHTLISRAGNSPRRGHTGTGPAIRPTNGSKIVFRSSTIGFTAGKSMQADDSDIEFYDCLLIRSRMGPEVAGTSVIFQDSYAQEMYGPDDADGIYLHDQQAGQVIALRNSVFASGDDDGIDTLDSVVAIEDCIVRDWDGEVDADAKGISVFGGSADIRRCLIVDNHIGISAKDQTAATVTIERTTVVAHKVGIQSDMKDSSMANARVRYFAHTSVFRAPAAVVTDYPQFPDDIQVAYSDLSTAWPGSGNTLADPRFMDASAKNFHLQAASPCIDAGDPAAAPDPDGTRADMGAFPYEHSSPEPTFARGRVNDDAAVDLADALAILLHMFASLPIGCADSADLTDDGAIDVADAIRLLVYLFQEGSPPAAPAGECGPDPTGDALGCAAPPACV